MIGNSLDTSLQAAQNLSAGDLISSTVSSVPLSSAAEAMLSSDEDNNKEEEGQGNRKELEL